MSDRVCAYNTTPLEVVVDPLSQRLADAILRALNDELGRIARKRDGRPTVKSHEVSAMVSGYGPTALHLASGLLLEVYGLRQETWPITMAQASINLLALSTHMKPVREAADADPRTRTLLEAMERSYELLAEAINEAVPVFGTREEAERYGTGRHHA